MPRDFRESVTLELLMERVVPPFRPPEVRVAGALLTAIAILGLVGGAIGLQAMAAGGGPAMLVVVVLVAAICGVGAYWFLRQQARQRATYIALHHMARDRARRMLSGKGSLELGDSRERLEAEAILLVRMQEPLPKGATWAFIWWESEG